MFLVTILLSILSGTPSHNTDPLEVQFRLMPSSYVMINGTSNINSFSCTYSFSGYPKEGFKTSSEKAPFKLDSVTVEIPVAAFDCGNRFLKKDFMNTLEYKNHPQITMSMPSLLLAKQPSKSKKHSKVSLNIGGETKNQQVNYQINWIDDKVFIMEGKAIVDITDFELEPASRLFGIVRVNKEVEILFLFKFVRH